MMSESNRWTVEGAGSESSRIRPYDNMSDSAALQSLQSAAVKDDEATGTAVGCWDFVFSFAPIDRMLTAGMEVYFVSRVD